MYSGKLEKTPELVWWEQVSGPSLFLREAAEVLYDGKHLCLIIPDSLPWREFFFEKLKETVHNFDDTMLFEEIDNANTAEDPGKFLVGHFDLEADYRPTKTYSEFLRQSNALAERIIFVTAESSDSARHWMDFAKGYKPSTRRDGLMLIEARGMPPGNTPKHLSVLSYEDFVTEYDTQIFAGLLIPENKLSIEQKKYLTAIAVSLLGIDALSVANFIQTFRLDADSPELPGDGLSEVDRYHRVWNAQVQTLFPLIMRECREMADSWRDKIEDAFAYANAAFPQGLLDSYQERITSPDEIVEIGTIHFLMRSRRRDSFSNETGDYMLYIPDESARARIKLLYSMRNKIAHGKVCPIEDVVSLLSPL
jgi:hypothetical protein